ncbi:aldo/keto reductase [Brevundimonas sp. NIBR11]|uniref:aldo/keto reductase n=1 Tax=Brevundimonas sp. NIBR11 TaxID=3015999 RepID=UPI0022F03669|nr:aldo/keto reductase [Brevundimonas sp. NIBR11]WGM30040.1 1-deoxyxylulose-5-phosphate synthase YajO [Brevundimonas sp. NIBR11]
MPASKKRALGKSGLATAPLVFGGNVFGWTIDKDRSFEILDAYVGAGFNAVDTADAYSTWVPGNKGGESETIIGEWLKARRRRDDVLILTKVGSPMGQHPDDRKDLSPAWIERAIEDSLRRLQTDHVDLYQSHWMDPDTPHDATLEAYDRLIKAGKVRAVGASNFDAASLKQALDVSASKGLPRYETLQPHYNLYSRSTFEGPLQDLAVAEGMGVITYFSLESGFLTGKYNSVADLEGSARGGGMKSKFDERGVRILRVLDAVAQRNEATSAQVALAWLLTRPGVTAPIVSATSVGQLNDTLKAATLTLSSEDLKDLTEASDA